MEHYEGLYLAGWEHHLGGKPLSEEAVPEQTLGKVFFRGWDEARDFQQLQFRRHRRFAGHGRRK